MRTIIEMQAEKADLEAKRASYLLELEGMTTRGGGMTAAKQPKFDRLSSLVEGIDAQLLEIREENLELIRASERSGWTEGAFDRPNSHHAPTDEPTRRRDAAMRAVDSCRALPGWTAEAGEAAERLIDQERFSEGPYRAESAASEVIRATASPEYVKAWGKLMRDPLNGHRRFTSGELEAYQRATDYVQTRAMSEGSTTVGAALVPYFLDPTINLTNNGVVSPIRGLASVKQITTNIWHGVSSQGVTAEWIGEATEVSDASPSFLQPTIQTYKADAYVQASMELIADAALSGEIAGLLAEAKGRLEGTAFAVGTGTAQPRGIITAVSGGANAIAGSSGAANSADLVAADIYNVANALPARYRQRGATWLASFTVLNKIRQLNIANTQTSSAFWASFGPGTPPELIGFPIHEVSDFDSTIVSGSADDVLLFGDISSYVIVDRIGLEVTYNPLVLGANRRPTGESGWVAFWRQGADMLNSGAARVLVL